jgi:hypothetical protein
MSGKLFATQPHIRRFGIPQRRQDRKYTSPQAVHHNPYFPAGFATLHLFRFEAGKIVELWDLGQPMPAESPNKDGMF